MIPLSVVFLYFLMKKRTKEMKVVVNNIVMKCLDWSLYYDYNACSIFNHIGDLRI